MLIIILSQYLIFLFIGFILIGIGLGAIETAILIYFFEISAENF